MVAFWFGRCPTHPGGQAIAPSTPGHVVRKDESLRVLHGAVSTPLVPHSRGKRKGFGGHPQTLGKGTSSLCTLLRAEQKCEFRSPRTPAAFCCTYLSFPRRRESRCRVSETDETRRQSERNVGGAVPTSNRVGTSSLGFGAWGFEFGISCLELGVRTLTARNKHRLPEDPAPGRPATCRS
jgi:hypothetical protein